MPHKSKKNCPIYGCNDRIYADRIMCSSHFKMMPRETQCDFFGMKAKVEKGEEPNSELIKIGNLAVQQVAEEAASRRENMRQALGNLKSMFAT